MHGVYSPRWRSAALFGKHGLVRNAVRVLACLLLASCHRSEQARSDSDGGPATEGGAIAMATAPPPPPPDNAPRLGITAMQVWVHESPSGGARKVGYLRLGAMVARSEKPAGTDGCPGGWYTVYPRGYVCVGDEATLDVKSPVVRAASTRPDLTRPLPYHYGFVRAVAPQYLKVPNKDEQTASEFALDKHLAWWAKDGSTANVVVPGANDVALDVSGVAVDGAPLPAGLKRSTDMTAGELFGGASDADPVPFWLCAATPASRSSAASPRATNRSTGASPSPPICAWCPRRR